MTWLFPCAEPTVTAQVMDPGKMSIHKPSWPLTWRPNIWPADCHIAAQGRWPVNSGYTHLGQRLQINQPCRSLPSSVQHFLPNMWYSHFLGHLLHILLTFLRSGEGMEQSLPTEPCGIVRSVAGGCIANQYLTFQTLVCHSSVTCNRFIKRFFHRLAPFHPI